MLPDARELRGRPGHDAGDVPASVEQAGVVQGPRGPADLAVPDRDERLPRLPGEAQRPHTRTVRAAGPRLRGAVPAAVPRPDAPRGPARIGGGAGHDRTGG